MTTIHDQPKANKTDAGLEGYLSCQQRFPPAALRAALRAGPLAVA